MVNIACIVELFYIYIYIHIYFNILFYNINVTNFVQLIILMLTAKKNCIRYN